MTRARQREAVGPPAVAPAAAAGAVTVPIRCLVRDPRYQVRAKLDPGAVARYANVLAGGGILPPVMLARVGGALVVVDGWHRLAAHERCGLREVEAEVVQATASQAQWMAAAANLRHGVPLRKAEIRTAFKALIRARKHIVRPGVLLSYRELAVELGGLVRHTTVVNWMRQDFSRIARQMAGEEPVKAPREAARDDEAGFYNTFTAALDTAGANAAAVRCPERRGDMVEAAQRLLKALEQAGEWATGEF